jgi:hypothetical protein
LQRVLSFIEVNVSRIALFGLAGVITFFGLYTTPNQFQSYYWRSCSITYTLPIILLLMLLGFLVKRREKQATWWQVGLIGLFSFFAGGFSETNAALQITLLVLGLAGILVYGRKMGPANRSHALWIGALVGAFAAIGVILLSPGNAIRMSQMPEPPGFFRWLYLSFRYALGFVYNGLVGTILPRGFSFLFGLAGTLIFVWKGIRAKSIIWSLLAIPAAVFLLAAAVCAPSAYAQSAYPENRALTGINLILTAGVILEGCMLGVLFQIWMVKQPIITSAVKHNLAVGAVLLLSGYLIYGGIQVLKGAAYYQTRAAAWDTRAAQIEEFRLSGDTSPVVTALDSTNGVAELSSDPYNWVNLCAATYYQVEQITAK